MDGRRFLRAMARFGWTVHRQKGSHRQLVHPVRPDRITVAFHDTIGRNIVRKVLKHAGIEEADFLNVL